MYLKCLANTSSFLTDWFSGAEVTMSIYWTAEEPAFDSRKGDTRFFVLLHGVRIGFAAHPLFYSVGTRISFPGVKAAGE
jgi:hypothetical protein